MSKIVPKKETLKQRFAEIPVRIKLDKDGNRIIKDADEEYLKAVKEWLQQKREHYLKASGYVSGRTMMLSELLEELE